MELIYSTQINKIGDNANEFLEHNMFVTFKDNAPQELENYCYIHSENNLVKEILTDDVLSINNVDYKITSVGELVNQNLSELGHITFKFTGEKDGAIGGTLYLEKKEIAPIGVGTILKIIRK